VTGDQTKLRNVNSFCKIFYSDQIKADIERRYRDYIKILTQNWQELLKEVTKRLKLRTASLTGTAF
jgi:hypothetical protein